MVYPNQSRYSDHFTKYLWSIAYPEYYSKDTVLLRPSDVNNRIWYIRSGLAKIFHFSEDHRMNKRPVIDCFLADGDFICAVDSFFGKEPNRHYVQLLADSSLSVITYAQLEATRKLFPETTQFEREIILGFKQRSDFRSYLLSLPAQLRDETFSRLFDTSRLQQQDIVSYLNVSRSHYSRTRSARSS
ncbi:cyclic nucleotide-binding domain-containing protein [Mucilaginibacter sp. PAMB04274]|uniref:Crp/Fnr family transcriptional regulator n=1 Tax=Mucilaginibacter sp. PAMB04274 TaxID=3138568 RepID=UPI0031F63B81